MVFTRGRTIASAPNQELSGCVLPHTTEQACNTKMEPIQKQKDTFFFFLHLMEMGMAERRTHLRSSKPAESNTGGSRSPPLVTDWRSVRLRWKKDEKEVHFSYIIMFYSELRGVTNPVMPLSLFLRLLFPPACVPWSRQKPQHPGMICQPLTRAGSFLAALLS